MPVVLSDLESLFPSLSLSYIIGSFCFIIWLSSVYGRSLDGPLPIVNPLSLVSSLSLDPLIGKSLVNDKAKIESLGSVY